MNGLRKNSGGHEGRPQFNQTRAVAAFRELLTRVRNARARRAFFEGFLPPVKNLLSLADFIKKSVFPAQALRELIQFFKMRHNPVQGCLCLRAMSLV